MTKWDEAMVAISEHGCDCEGGDELEDHTCLAGRCELALVAERARSLSVEERVGELEGRLRHKEQADLFRKAVNEPTTSRKIMPPVRGFGRHPTCSPLSPCSTECPAGAAPKVGTDGTLPYTPPAAVLSYEAWEEEAEHEPTKQEWDSVFELFENAPGFKTHRLVRLMIAYGEHVSGWASVGGDEVLAMAVEFYGDEFVEDARQDGAFDDLLRQWRKGEDVLAEKEQREEDETR